MPVAQAEEWKQPRKALQVGEQLVDKDTVSNSSFNFIQNGSSGLASLDKVQEDGVQDVEVMRPSLFARNHLI
jgi:hypothetical protein